MASATAADPPTEPPRKKLKTADLPLSSATRSAIESLAHTFKKKGGYDALRKQVWDKFEATDNETQFTKSIIEVAEKELEERAETLLSLERSKAALLIEGAVERTGIYQTAEEQIDKLIHDHIETISNGIRAIRRDDVGEEQAAAEELKGSKTDEQYAEDTANRQRERARFREEIRIKELAIAEQKRKIEKAKKREEEKIREAEEEKRRIEREARRKAEREAEAARELERESSRAQRERDRISDDDSRRNDSLRDNEAPSKAKLSKEDVERLEQEALEELLNEGRRKSQRSRHQLELEIDETLAPPPRKTMPASAINPISRDTPTRVTDKKDFPKNKLDDDSSKLGSGTPRLEDIKDKERERHRSRDHSRSRDDRREKDDRRRSSKDRDDRRRNDSRDRDYRRSRDRSRSHDRDRRRSYRSRSRDGDRDRRRRSPAVHTHKTIEQIKLEAAQKRAEEAKAYMEALKEAKAKGLPVPGDRPRQPQSDGFVKPAWGGRSQDGHGSRKRDAESVGLSSPLKEHRDVRSGSRTSTTRYDSRVERSTSPVNIDRYVPGSSSRRRSEVPTRSPTRKRSRSRDRDREKNKERDYRRRDERDSERSHRRSGHDDDRDSSHRSSRRRSRSRDHSRSHRKDRSRDRGHDRDRSRSPIRKKESSRRDRSRSRSRDRRDSRRHRSKSRDRDRDRERHKDRRTSDASTRLRSRSRESKRESSRKDY